MRVCLKMARCMARAYNISLTETDMKVCLKMARCMGRA